MAFNIKRPYYKYSLPYASSHIHASYLYYNWKHLSLETNVQLPINGAKWIVMGGFLMHVMVGLIMVLTCNRLSIGC